MNFEPNKQYQYLDGVAAPRNRRPNHAPRQLPHRLLSRPAPPRPIDLSLAPLKPRRHQRRWPRRLALSFGCLLLIAASGVWWLRGSIIAQNFGASAPALQAQVDPAELKGEGDGRINILLIGVGDGGHQAADLADSIMLVSLDPTTKNVALLSIPRDLYVDIPQYGSAKINAAHAYGEQYDHPGGGPALLKQTLSSTLDVPVHYFIRLDFDGFRRAIDTAGGVTVTLKEPLIDEAYPDEQLSGYGSFSLNAGEHSLDGDTALKYARSRYSTSDFDRSRRQQELLLAFREKVLSAETAANPATIAGLLGDFAGNVKTDLRPDEIVRLAELSAELDEAKVTRAQLDSSEDNFLSFSNIFGASALVPTAGDFSQIQAYVRGLLVDGFIKDEKAGLSLLNGTGQDGLATETAALLRSYGYRVDHIDNASDSGYNQSVIFDYSGDNPYTLRYLEERFGVSAERRQRPAGAAMIDIDIEIVIGSDYEPASR